MNTVDSTNNPITEQNLQIKPTLENEERIAELVNIIESQKESYEKERASKELDIKEIENGIENLKKYKKQLVVYYITSKKLSGTNYLTQATSKNFENKYLKDEIYGKNENDPQNNAEFNKQLKLFIKLKKKLDSKKDIKENQKRLNILKTHKTVLEELKERSELKGKDPTKLADEEIQRLGQLNEKYDKSPFFSIEFFKNSKETFNLLSRLVIYFSNIIIFEKFLEKKF